MPNEDNNPVRQIRRKMTADERADAIEQLRTHGGFADDKRAGIFFGSSGIGGDANHRVRAADAASETDRHYQLTIAICCETPVLRAKYQYNAEKECYEIVLYELVLKHTADAVDFGTMAQAQGAPFFNDHKSDNGFLGLGTSISEDLIARMHNPVLRDGALFADIRFAKGVERCEAAYKEMAAGLTPDVSIGAILDTERCEWEETPDGELDRMICSGWEVYECSRVKIPAISDVGLTLSALPVRQVKRPQPAEVYNNKNAADNPPSNEETNGMTKPNTEKLNIINAALAACAAAFTKAGITPPTADELADLPAVKNASNEELSQFIGDHLAKLTAGDAADTSGAKVIAAARGDLIAAGVSEAAVAKLMADAATGDWSADMARANMATAKSMASASGDGGRQTTKAPAVLSGARGFFASIGEIADGGKNELSELSDDRRNELQRSDAGARLMNIPGGGQGRIYLPASQLATACLSNYQAMGGALPKDLERFAIDSSGLGGGTDTDEMNIIGRLVARAGILPLVDTLPMMLNRNVGFPVESNEYNFTYRTDHDTAIAAGGANDQVDYSSQKVISWGELATRFTVSRGQLSQSVMLGELIRRRLMEDLPRALNKLIISRSAAPLGILNAAGVNSITPSSRTAPTYAEVIDMITEIGKDNIDTSNLVFAMNSAVEGYLLTTQKFSGTNGDPILQGMPAPIMHGGMTAPVMSKGSISGVPVVTDNNIPNNLVEAGNNANNNETAILLGKFDELCLGYWSDAVLLVDSSSATAQADGNIHLSLYVMVSWIIKHPQGFATLQCDIQ